MYGLGGKTRVPDLFFLVFEWVDGLNESGARVEKCICALGMERAGVLPSRSSRKESSRAGQSRAGH